MKTVDYLIIQSTTTPKGAAFGKADIIDLHTAKTIHGGFGWNRPGIDLLIRTDGALETLIPDTTINSIDLWGIAEGKKGILGNYKYIAYEGGLNAEGDKQEDTRTSEQIGAIETLVRYHIMRYPKIQVLGFNEAPGKTKEPSPAFEVSTWLKELGIPKLNIYKKKA